MSERSATGRKRSKRIYIYWGVALALLLSLGLFCWQVVVPVWRVRRLAGELSRTREWNDPLKRLGGPERALPALSLYLAMPQRIAPSKWVAVTLLGECGDRAVPAIVGALRDREAVVREVAAGRLAGVPRETLGEAGLQALIAALGDEAIRVRFTAAETLGELGADARPAVPALREALKDASVVIPAWSEQNFSPERTVRDGALKTLGQIGPPAAGAAPDIERLLAAPSVRTRFHAARSLWRVTGRAEKSVPALAAMAGTGYPWSASAMDLLGRMGPAARPAIPVLEEAAQRGGEFERKAAAEALKRIRKAAPAPR